MEHLQVSEEELRKWGWYIKPQALLELVGNDPSHSSIRDPLTLVGQLLDSDLKDVGASSLPDSRSLQRISRLQGPLVLQVVSIRNICQTSSKSSLQTGHEHVGGRLLRIHLTDGCTTIPVIEYHSMPAFSMDVAPGTKVKLENTVSMQSGFLLGDARSFKILGGHVSALHESWEMERKYAGLARLTTKATRAEDDSGPPPFHGLHVSRQRNHSSDKKPPAAVQGAHTMDPVQRASVQQDKSSSECITVKGSELSQREIYNETGNNPPDPSPRSSGQASSSRQSEIKTNIEGTSAAIEKVGDVRKDAIKAALALGVETIPSHNRAAAQKLLEKRDNFNSIGRGRGHGHGGRGRGRRGARQLEEATLTLEEWEARRGASTPSSSRVANAFGEEASFYDDEALAQKLHYQLNVESNEQLTTTADPCNEADQIRLSMFSFAGANDKGGQGRHGGRGRGRGRGRRRGRY